jgi:hypothetical protein
MSELSDAHSARRMSKPTPIGALLRGFAAGAVGVAGLDLVQLWHYRRDGGDQPTVDWELSRGLTWADAPAPAQVGRRAVEGIFDVELQDRWAPLTNNATHWGYGVAWAGLFGLVESSTAKARLRHGLSFGTFVWLVGYVILPVAKLYRPLWKYDPATLGWDWAGHLAYGLGTAATLRILDR